MFVFFFKQKTAYEMRISDWSSDVCSSDLLAQDGIEKSTITAFTLAFFAYNLKPLWAWVIDGLRLPLIGSLGQRVSWMILTGLLVMAATVNLALADPDRSVEHTSELQSLMRISYAVFCLTKKKQKPQRKSEQHKNHQL